MTGLLGVLPAALEAFREVIVASAESACLLRAGGEPPRSRQQTQAGGDRPFLPASLGRPMCATCNEPLAFVWQVNFAELPENGIASAGLLQLFGCVNDGCDGCFPFDSDGRVESGFETRWLSDLTRFEGDEQLEISAEAIAPVCTFQPEHFLSVPSALDDRCAILHHLYDKVMDERGRESYLSGVYQSTPNFYLEAKMLSRVGGFAPWIHDAGDEFEPCDVCGARPKLICSLGSDDTDIYFGDSGYVSMMACNATEACLGLVQPQVYHESL